MKAKRVRPAKLASLKPAGVCIEITPSVEQYERLRLDLAALRRAGAPSNTAAVVSAVHEAARAKLGSE